MIRPPPPVIAEVEALLGQGKLAEAVILGYLSAEADVRQAFGLQLPRNWTHREFLRDHLRPDMGYVAVLLPRLYAIYEPVRYGSARPIDVPAVRELVRAIYNEGPIFNLYRDGVRRSAPPGAPGGLGGGRAPLAPPRAGSAPRP